MDKLKVDLFRYKTLVYGRVIHTPENLRSKNNEKELGRLGEYMLLTCMRPQLSGTLLYVHGAYRAEDDSPIYCKYPSELEANKAIVMFKLIIDEINKNLEKEEEE